MSLITAANLLESLNVHYVQAFGIAQFIISLMEIYIWLWTQECFSVFSQGEK